jgi:hypothetical protein
MNEPDLVFSGSLIRRGRVHLMSIFLVLAIICLLAIIINLIAGADNLPRGLEGSTPWFGVGLAIFGALSAWVGWTSRIKMRVYKSAQLIIKVQDRVNPLLLEGPFTLKYGYTRIKIPRVPTTTCLLLGLYQGDKCVLSLREEWGTIHGTPDGWPSELPQLEPAPFYDVMAGKLLTRLVSIVEEGKSGSGNETGTG